MTDWTWVNSGQLLSDTYAPWAVDEPSSSMGHVYMSHADDFLYAVQLGTATNKNYMCEAGRELSYNFYNYYYYYYHFYYYYYYY